MGSQGNQNWTEEQREEQRQRLVEIWKRRKASPASGSGASGNPGGLPSDLPSGARSSVQSRTGSNLLEKAGVKKTAPTPPTTPTQPGEVPAIEKALPWYLKKINRGGDKVLRFSTCSEKIPIEVYLDPLDDKEAEGDAEFFRVYVRAWLPGWMQRNPFFSALLGLILVLAVKLNWKRKEKPKDDNEKKPGNTTGPGR